MSAHIKPGNAALCRECGLLFPSEHAFAKHRTGPFAPINKPDTRRCLTESELSARGWAPNARGQWRKPAPADKFARII